MDAGVLSYLTAVIGGVNLLFLLKIIFGDIKDLRDKLDAHLMWHLDSPKYHIKRTPALLDDDQG